MSNELTSTEHSNGSEVLWGGLSRTMAAIVIAGIGTLGVAGVSGCQTTKGAGEDMENLGENISDTADDASR